MTGKEEELAYINWENIFVLTDLAFWKWQGFVIVTIVIYLLAILKVNLSKSVQGQVSFIQLWNPPLLHGQSDQPGA